MNKLTLTPDHSISKYVRVTLDGQDVTQDCFLADEKNGEVGLFKRGEDGKRYLDGNDVASERKKGMVVISLRGDAPDEARDQYLDLRGAEND